ncbi:hypothetical protein CAOG_002920 [Capsaspora owczarzaki ATCC 30864]|uniref:NOD3 protein n=1 Tax=Capsaspora owczarzaki (strain ATCC 30864) TaxID=595528 RepID=A0A0D2X230_CAPO3|nr:hypothetical protein CAOG_002920 [Capsaspora owczarzaki ATCC 30864]
MEDSLRRNEIGDVGAQAIAEALKVNMTLMALNLIENQVGDAGAQALAEGLSMNKVLTSLSLMANRIGDVGAQAIAEAHKANSTVASLDLCHNQIGHAGACAIAAALKVNKTVTQLSLDYNCMGGLGSQAIDEACKGKSGFQLILRDQINPLAFSFLPRLASAEDIQEVFRMLTSGLELENQRASLPALPTEIAELIMDEAHYWRGVQHTMRGNHGYIALRVTVPQGNSIRVKAIQVLRDKREHPDNTVDDAFDLTVQDEQGVVQYECAVHPTFVNSNLALATIWPASHPIIRQMREGWQVQVGRNKVAFSVLFESLYVGYADRQ